MGEFGMSAVGVGGLIGGFVGLGILVLVILVIIAASSSTSYSLKVSRYLMMRIMKCIWQIWLQAASQRLIR